MTRTASLIPLCRLGGRRRRVCAIDERCRGICRTVIGRICRVAPAHSDLQRAYVYDTRQLPYLVEEGAEVVICAADFHRQRPLGVNLVVDKRFGNDTLDLQTGALRR